MSTDYRTADLTDADRAMLDFAVRLTREPWAVADADVEGLRAHGFDDVAIHDIVQVTALFNYYTRLADGLGIEGEPEWTRR
ncbi:MAG: peroxidase [Acidobacteriota bacterium]